MNILYLPEISGLSCDWGQLGERKALTNAYICLRFKRWEKIGLQSHREEMCGHLSSPGWHCKLASF